MKELTSRVSSRKILPPWVVANQKAYTRKWKAANRDRVNRYSRDWNANKSDAQRSAERLTQMAYQQRSRDAMARSYLIGRCARNHRIPYAAVTEQMISSMRRRLSVLRSRRIDQSIADAMRQLASSGETLCSIAALYGCSIDLVWCVLKNKTRPSQSMPGYIPARVIKSIKRIVAITSGAQSIINGLNTNREVA